MARRPLDPEAHRLRHGRPREDKRPVAVVLFCETRAAWRMCGLSVDARDLLGGAEQDVPARALPVIQRDHGDSGGHVVGEPGTQE